MREKLPPNPDKDKIRKEQIVNDKREIETQAMSNKTHGLKGKVSCFYMRMMKPITNKQGFLNIFPNFRHGSRIDGLGMPSLSPMKMGPVDHGQPNLPPALNLENLHQGNKCFSEDVGSDGQPNHKFYEMRLSMYQDPIPHRHKDSSGHKNSPLYSVWVAIDGHEVHLPYIESRQIYCHFYEQFALKSDEFRKLQQLINDGYNSQICGYDGYEPTKTLDEHYLDPSRPFGHEMVLYTLLTTNPTDYPWRKHQNITLK